MSLTINTARLLHHSAMSDWGYSCRITLLRLAGLRPASEEGIPAPITPEEMTKLPATFAYADLRHFTGRALLDVADSLDDADPIKHGAGLLLALAREFFVPEIPQDHAGYMETLRLLRSVQAYLEGRIGAEAYMAAAFAYRSRFCTTWENDEKDPDFADLFDAMPSGGLESVIALNGWRVAGHWECFGRFLVRRLPEFRALDDLREAVEGTIFVEDDEDHDKEAEEAAQRMIDEEIAVYRSAMLEHFDERLAVVVDGFLGYTPAA